MMVKFYNYTTAQGLPNNYVGCITVDKSGNIWFGTLNGSISQYDGKSFTNYTINQELANNLVRCILQIKNLWFGTDAGGASRFDGKNFSIILPQRGFRIMQYIKSLRQKQEIFGLVPAAERKPL